MLAKKNAPADKVISADTPFWALVKSLTTGQFYGIMLVLVSLFGAGYAIGQWASSAGHVRELASLEDTHRQAQDLKDGVISERDARISALEIDLDASKQAGEEALQVASNANRSARLYRAKAEFLNRYLSYIEDPDPAGAMRKLFADHVCALWRETQRDILSLENDEITLQRVSRVSRGNNLGAAAFEALESVGISREMVDEYRRLDRRRSQIEPGSSRVQPDPFGRSNNRVSDAEFRRLQQLESQIGGALQKGVSTKTVSFFDGSRYLVPQPVADDVHRRDDCQS